MALLDLALLATLRIHNPWLDRPGDQQELLAASLPEPFVARRRPMVSRGAHSFLEAYRPACLGVVNASLRLDTVEEGVTIRFVRPWEIDLVLGELER